MKRLTIALLTFIISTGIWSELIYVDCGKRLNECKDEICETDFGLLLLLDLEEKTYLTTYNPLAKLQRPTELRLKWDEILIGEGAYSLKKDKGLLKIVDSEHKIYLGFGDLLSPDSNFIREGVIDRVELTFNYLMHYKTKHQCNLTTRSQYNSKIQDWKKRLDEDRLDYEGQRKF